MNSTFSFPRRRRLTSKQKTSLQQIMQLGVLRSNPHNRLYIQRLALVLNLDTAQITRAFNNMRQKLSPRELKRLEARKKADLDIQAYLEELEAANREFISRSVPNAALCPDQEYGECLLTGFYEMLQLVAASVKKQVPDFVTSRESSRWLIQDSCQRIVSSASCQRELQRINTL